MIEAKIIEIGNEAYQPEDNMLILFGSKATAGLKPYAIIQEIPDRYGISLKEGDSLVLGEQTYTIEHVGRLAAKNLQEIAHTVLLFAPVPGEVNIPNGIYLFPYALPQLKAGDQIVYPGGVNHGA